MTFKVKDKTILIAGAKGAANAIAELLCDNGAKVIVNDDNEKAMETITAPVAAKKQHGTSMDDAKKLVEEVIEEHGKIDVLIINYDEFKAGKKRLDQYTEEHYDKVMNGNVYPVFHYLAAIRPHFRERQDTGDLGAVLIMTSLVGSAGLDLATMYAAAKGAVNGMIRSVAKEFGKFARVNGIAQGFYAEKTARVGPKDRQKKFYMITSTWMSRFDLNYTDVAPMAALLVSDDAKLISGQIFHVDGGLWLRVQA
ncbi:SDR family oxidoreductase [Candidatus Bathyarchaeota archaeon]|nr:SDR family oxidoreductase [Candidatus Bathyarchaeota archaeon]